MKLFFRSVFTLIALVVFMPSAQAAMLFFEPGQVEAAPGQQFEVGFFLDTQNDDINALEGSVTFPTDALVLKEIRDSNSIINFWIERPATEDHPVRFSGIIPGGYRFPKGMVLSLVFEAKQEAQGVIAIEGARTLRNDGQGTEVPLTTTFVAFKIAPEFTAPVVSQIVDTVPPEVFTPELARDPSIFDGQWFLSFATQDKGSGISHYEIREASFWGKGPWTRGESPYLLKQQDPTHGISIKAIDRAGNERIVFVPGTRTDRGYELAALLGILLLTIGIILRNRFRFGASSKKNVR